MSTLPTPRTDAITQADANGHWAIVPADFARQLERELTEAKAERDALKAALAIGQENCDAEYNRLRDERDEMTKVAQGACKAEGEALKREDRWRALAEELAGALEPFAKMAEYATRMSDTTGFWTHSSSVEGESYQVTVKHARTGQACLAHFRDAANPASGAAITPDSHRTAP